MSFFKRLFRRDYITFILISALIFISFFALTQLQWFFKWNRYDDIALRIGLACIIGVALSVVIAVLIMKYVSDKKEVTHAVFKIIVGVSVVFTILLFCYTLMQFLNNIVSIEKPFIILIPILVVSVFGMIVIVRILYKQARMVYRESATVQEMIDIQYASFYVSLFIFLFVGVGGYYLNIQIARSLLANMQTALYTIVLLSVAYSILVFKERIVSANINNTFRQFNPSMLGVILVLISIVAVALRVPGLGALIPYTDEALHLMAANKIVETGVSEYERAYFLSELVALLVSYFEPKSLSEYLHIARLPGAVLGGLTVIPVYFLARKHSVLTGLIAALLWAIAPWAIGVSRYVREYTYITFFFISTLALFDAALVDMTRSDKTITEKLKNPLLYLSGILFVAFLIFIFIIDKTSTAKIGLVFYAILFGYHMIINIKSITSMYMRASKIRQAVYLAVVAFVLLAGFALAWRHEMIHFFTFERAWITVFFSQRINPRIWWAPLHVFPNIVLFLIVISVLLAWVKQQKRYLFFFMLFMISVGFYYAIFNRYFSPRYIFYVLPLFTIVVASGINYLFEYVTAIPKQRIMQIAGVVIVILFIGAIIKFPNTMLPITSKPISSISGEENIKTGWDQTTGEYLQEINSTFDFLEDHADFEKDFFISTYIHRYLGLLYSVPQENIYHAKYSDKDFYENIERYIREHDTGWFVTDYRRYVYLHNSEPRYPLLVGESYIIDDKKLTLESYQDEMFIYRWEPVK